MTDSERGLEAIRRAADVLLPQLSERLARHGLGEIEIRSGELRIRVSGGGQPVDATPGTPLPAAADEVTPPAAPATEPAAAPTATEPAPPAPAPDSAQAVSSPAVGFFVYGEGLGPGLAVDKGDALGYVEMLGVRHDVRAPRRGTVRNLVAESGEPVEYGQVVLELDGAGMDR
jgi:acetyl-CoA carboxylase biotin carboxyl carrier protein